MSALNLVLVVEDDVAAAEFLQLALRAMGHEVAIAVDGQQALEMAAERPPQLVLLDALLPKPFWLRSRAEELGIDAGTRKRLEDIYKSLEPRYHTLKQALKLLTENFLEVVQE